MNEKIGILIKKNTAICSQGFKKQNSCIVSDFATGHYLNQWWPNLLTHISVTWPQWVKMILIILPEQRSCWGVYWFQSVRPSVRPSARLSRLPCPPCNIYSSGWILSILATNDHYHEKVCHTQWPLTLPISSRSFDLDLENRVRSVASTVLDGFFYLAQMITIIRGCVTCYVFFSIWKLDFLANFFNFSVLPLKKNLQLSMDSFHI